MLLNKDYNLPATVEAQIIELLESIDDFSEKELEDAENYVELITLVRDMETFLTKSVQVIQSAMRQEVPFETFMLATNIKEPEEVS